jgi:hypothetical protein|tara:strand:+ start:186 stop:443 length:258 start_codon:yes stop_codon:yes gene_type:complete
MIETFDSLKDHDKFVVVFDPVSGTKDEFIVFFGTNINERRFAGHADLDKVKRLLTNDQREHFRKRETLQFYIEKEKVIREFEDIY